MGRLVGANTRAWMLCTVALLWAWEATADDPDAVASPVSGAPAAAAPAGDFSLLWHPPVQADERSRAGR